MKTRKWATMAALVIAAVASVALAGENERMVPMDSPAVCSAKCQVDFSNCLKNLKPNDSPGNCDTPLEWCLKRCK